MALNPDLRDTDLIDVSDRSTLPYYADNLALLGITPDDSKLGITPDGTGVVPFLASWRIPLASVPTTINTQFQWMQQANVLLPAAVRRMIGYNSDQSETTFLFTELGVEFIDGAPGATSYTQAQIAVLMQSYAFALGSGNNQRFFTANEAGTSGANRALNGATTVAATTLASAGYVGSFSDGGVTAIEGAGIVIRPKNDAQSCVIECLRTHGLTIQGDLYIRGRGVGFLGGPINATNSTGAQNPCNNGVTTLGAFRARVSNTLRTAVAAKSFRVLGMRG